MHANNGVPPVNCGVSAIGGPIYANFRLSVVSQKFLTWHAKTVFKRRLSILDSIEMFAGFNGTVTSQPCGKTQNSQCAQT